MQWAKYWRVIFLKIMLVAFANIITCPSKSSVVCRTWRLGKFQTGRLQSENHLSFVETRDQQTEMALNGHCNTYTELGIWTSVFSGSGKRDECGFSGFAWNNYIEDRKSTRGYFFEIACRAVLWSSCKQRGVSNSNYKAEYISLGAVGREAFWLHRLFLEKLHCSRSGLTIFRDSYSAITFTETRDTKLCS